MLSLYVLKWLEWAPRKAELVAFGAFALLFDLSLVLGYHIVVNDGYNGLMDANYIVPYNALDVVAYVFIFVNLLLYCMALYRAVIAGASRLQKKGTPVVSVSNGRISVKHVVVVAAILFALWVPYLVVYYPGFVFNDTIYSIRQLVGIQDFDNWHPLTFTLLLGECLNIAQGIGFTPTEGIALYCVLQMTFMALCFSYFSWWIVSRGNVTGKARLVVVALVIAFFGLSPYFSTYTIALWKDPVFSAAALMLTLMLADIAFALSGGGVFLRTRKIAAIAVFALIVALFRNNGAFILLLCALALGFVLLLGRRKKGSALSAHVRKTAKGALMALLVVGLGYFALTGPGFKILGIEGSPKVESVGIPLNQMARVAALDGDMTESDREYLDGILPYELYSETYRPCCVDLLKWDGNFNATAMADGFVEHWLSLFVQNPRAYFEAWELQTFGFWTVNQPAVNEFDNIKSGSICPNDQLALYGIDGTRGVESDLVRQLFPQDETSLPIGVIFWMMLYLAACLSLSGRSKWVLALMPSLGLMLTLLVALPIWYWPRYALVLQLLVPFYLLLFYLMGKADRLQA